MTGRPVLRLTLWTAGLIGAIAGLYRLGSGDLGGPPVRAGAAALGHWVTTRDPASVLMVLVRWLALGTAMYLLAVTVLALVAHASRAASLISLSDRITVPLVRRLVGSVLGVAVAAGPLAGAPSAWAARLPPPPGVMLPAGGPADHAATAVETTAPALAPDPPTLRRLPDNDPTTGIAPTTTLTPPASAPAPPSTTVAPTNTASTTTPTTLAPPATTSPATTGSSATAASPATTEPLATAEAPASAAPPTTTAPTGPPFATSAPSSIAAPGATPAEGPAMEAPPATWTVRPGESLWRIALLSLQAARRRPVSDAEVAPYWLSVVERNRASLPDPANADLLYVGMTVVLPPIP